MNIDALKTNNLPDIIIGVVRVQTHTYGYVDIFRKICLLKSSKQISLHVFRRCSHSYFV